MKYKDRVLKQNEQIVCKNNMNESNIGNKQLTSGLERNKFREHSMINEDFKNFYSGSNHHRHHSELSGMLSNNTSANMSKAEPKSEKVNLKFGNSSRKRKYLLSQKKIIREVFSPPIKNK